MIQKRIILLFLLLIPVSLPFDTVESNLLISNPGYLFEDNSARINLDINAIEVKGGSIQNTGHIYQISTDDHFALVSIYFNATGLTTMHNSTIPTGTVMGDFYYVLDGQATRVAGTRETDLGFELQLTLTSGYRVFSLGYFAMDNAEGFLYSIASMVFEIRPAGDTFTYSSYTATANVTEMDSYYEGYWTIRDMTAFNAFSGVSPDRKLLDQSEILEHYYDVPNSHLIYAIQYNSSGKIDYQNGTAPATPGHSFWFDARGLRVLEDPIYNTPLYLHQDYPTLTGIVLLRDAGLNYDLVQDAVDWEEMDKIFNPVVNASFDFEIESSMISVDDYFVTPSSSTTSSSTTSSSTTSSSTTSSSTTPSSTTPSSTTSTSTHDQITDITTSTGEKTNNSEPVPTVALPFQGMIVIFTLGAFVLIYRRKLK
jgi:hypothetical protein